jgi:hypothetical protein
VFVKDQIKVKNIKPALDKLEELSEVLPSFNDYILVNENFKATEAFQVLENYKDNSGIRRIKIKPSYLSECCSLSSGPGKGRLNDAKRKNELTLVLTKKEGDTLEHRNQAIYVPKGFKLLKLNLAYNGEGGKRPGNLGHLHSFLRENNTFPITLKANGSNYFVDILGAKAEYENPIEAKIALVKDLGLQEKDAEEILQTVDKKRKVAGYIKLAAIGDNTLSLVDELPETNELGQPTYYGTPWVDVDSNTGGQEYQDATQLGLGTKPDVEGVDSTVNQAVNLAQTGQKEISIHRLLVR